MRLVTKVYQSAGSDLNAKTIKKLPSSRFFDWLDLQNINAIIIYNIDDLFVARHEFNFSPGIIILERVNMIGTLLEGYGSLKRQHQKSFRVHPVLLIGLLVM